MRFNRFTGRIEAPEGVPDEDAVPLPTSYAPAPQPLDIATPLLPFQCESLTFMQEKEAGPTRGGILADEMGLGKTLQTISLIVETKSKPAPAFIGRRHEPAIEYVTPGTERHIAERLKEALTELVAEAKSAAKAAATAARRKGTSPGAASGGGRTPAKGRKPAMGGYDETTEDEADADTKAPEAKRRRMEAPAAAASSSSSSSSSSSGPADVVLGDTDDDAAPLPSSSTPAPAPGYSSWSACRGTVRIEATDFEVLSTLKTRSVPQLHALIEDVDADPVTGTYHVRLSEGDGSPPIRLVVPIPPSPLEPLSPFDTLSPDAPSGTTLVVAPVVALTQWKAEILRHARPGSLSVCIYHGPHRVELLGSRLTSFDVVLTSYSVLEAEYRKMVEATKTKCAYCGKLFLPDKLKSHLRYFCGPGAMKTAAQARQKRKGDTNWALRHLQAAHPDRELPAIARRGGDEEDDDDEEDSDASGSRSDGSGDDSGSDSGSVSGSDSSSQSSEDDEGGGAGRGAARGRAGRAGRGGRGGGRGGAGRGRGRGRGRAAAAAAASDEDDSVIVLSSDDSSEASSSSSDEEESVNDGEGGRTTWRGAGGGAGSSSGGSSKSQGGSGGSVLAVVDAAAPSKGGRGSSKTAVSAPAPKKGGGKAAASPAPKKGGSKAATEGKAASAKKLAGRKRRRDEDDDDSSDDSSSDDEEESDSSAYASSDGSEESSESESEEEGEEESEEEVMPAKKVRGGGGAGGPRKPRAPKAVWQAPSAEALAAAAAAGAKRFGPISSLFKVHWKRIVLDEAHNIKDRRCNTARAACSLKAAFRWCLTGTPLQNRISDLYSLFFFLRLNPFSSYMCKNCPCASNDLHIEAQTKVCAMCGHNTMSHTQWLTRHVTTPMEAGGARQAEALVALRSGALASCYLRRTKAGRAADLALPSRTILVKNDLRLDPFEQDFYNALYSGVAAEFDSYVDAGILLSNYAHVFDLLTQLRQAVNHPYLLLYGQGKGALATASSGAAYAAGTSGVCGLCREPLEDPVTTSCRHVFCRWCMGNYLESWGGNARGLLQDRTNEEAVLDTIRDAEILGLSEGGVGGGGDGEGGAEEGGGGVGDGRGGYGEEAGEGAPEGARKGKGGGKPRRKSKAADVAPANGFDGQTEAGSASSSGGGDVPTCPTCLGPLTVDIRPAPAAAADAAAAAASSSSSSAVNRSILARIPPERLGSAFRSSTKIEALLEALWQLNCEEPGAKALVFSQFVGFLQLIEHRLTHAGVRLVRLDGGMSITSRDRVLRAFREDPHVTVLLISLKAGGVALNLTSASHVFLMDPFWNPAADAQAMDRTCRLGQHRPVQVTRFVMADTIEGRILALQRQKQRLAESCVGSDATSITKLSEADMKFLFSR